MYGEEYLQNSLSSLNTNNRDEVITHNNGQVETDIEQNSKGKFFCLFFKCLPLKRLFCKLK